MASSPPPWDAAAPGTPQKTSTPSKIPNEEESRAISPEVTVLPKRAIDSAMVNGTNDNYVNKISILTSSLPFYHNQFMDQQREAKRRLEAGEDAIIETDNSESKEGPPRIDGLSLDHGPRLQSPEEQAETARRLKPNSLSTLALQSITAQPFTKIPEESSKPEAKRSKTRWQFGIRSRNLPYEAMHCVYKALVAQGAEWEIPPLPKPEPGGPPTSYPVHVEGAMRLDEGMHSSRAPSPELGRKAQNVSQQVGDKGSKRFEIHTDDGNETDDDEIDPNLVPSEYIPKDPWVIRARWRKDNMTPAGITQSLSTNSSRQDLASDPTSRRTSLIGSTSSTNNSKTDITSKSDSKSHISGTGACYVYMDIQLYTLDQPSDKNGAGTYLVDFKCAGYEPLMERIVDDTDKELIGVGYRLADKDVTSPQPFLDMTNKLVIYLAGGGGSS